MIASFGNVGPDKVAKNARLLLALTGSNAELYRGRRSAMDGVERESAAGEHGEDGLGGAKPRNLNELQSKMKEIEGRTKENGAHLVANQIIERYQRSQKGESVNKFTLAAVGPMTDLALILQEVKERDPAALSMIRGVSIMGGGIDIGQGDRRHTNVTDYAEFNFFQDPKAASIALNILQEAKIPTIIAPLDLTHTTSVDQKVQGAWLRKVNKKNATGDMIGQLCVAGGFDQERSKDLYHFKSPRRFMHDPNAIGVLNRPELYKGISAFVTIEFGKDNPKAGQMVVTAKKPGESNLMILVKGDAPKITDDWLKTFSK